MQPLELKKDRDGLLYVDNRKLLVNDMLLDKRKLDLDQKYYTHGYFRLTSTIDYIIKYCYTELTKKESNEYKEMLYNLVSKQSSIIRTDFPIGYFKDHRKVSGLIIKYYEGGISLDNILKEHDINLIDKYFLHDDDIIHNLFMLFYDIINNIRKMFDNNIYYLDINLSNFILYNNAVKIIDFEPRTVKFDNKDTRLINILRFYSSLVLKVLKEYNLYSSIDQNILSFDEAKVMLKKLENKAREQNGVKRAF